MTGNSLTVWARLWAALAVTGGAALSVPAVTPVAGAEPCPDVDVVFARGTFEPPGAGGVGQDFVDTLRGRLGDKSVDVYPVNYPASTDFPTAAQGVIDASNHIQNRVNACPDTKMVLGGFSQGAAVMGYVTADKIPDDFTPPDGITGPMPPEVADHVAAVALFGEPSQDFLNQIDAPPINIGSRYAPKTINLCIDTDPICSPTGNDGGSHGLYAANGMTGRAADFVAQRLNRW
ncbi:cutinase family protein [Mycolicibacillus parakoreensis]|uniref:Cutinase family protein n=1 Tax=Mycolicibacillus parakoreensis TaxID=1069221 RepID=A0ABY3U9T7_9MYCO|nr:cutinase family protein [Mycolicibacillus parakoreensis]MCV7317488.1 cutinase family protein [Mycolicibacillus parakoreensis]ULN54205.1 cutinase family protein [Mycolicibacillus parakoreensis]